MITHSRQQSDGFMPRKEFIKQSSHSLSSFALLTLTASSFIRLYSFPPLVVSSLRRYLYQHKFANEYREDVVDNYCEFTVQGKPWQNSKSITTERLLVNILAVILQCGYSFLSTLDYGRDQDDRIAMAFSKTVQPSANATGPSSSHPTIPTSFITAPLNQSTSTLPSSFTVPFAISFTSATTLRVISPPLQSTPAILGAVRESWPRGVVSEKKVGDACYEFKLKGYRWFQEDTFSTDSMQYILRLLQSLDSHSFSLLASLTLSNRSRVKDLWIFTGISDNPHQDLRLTSDLELPVSPPETPRTSELRGQKPPLLTKKKPLVGSPEGSMQEHKKMATAPALYSQDPGSSLSGHPTRAATDGDVSRSITPSHPHDVGMLRKPAPRTQAPNPIPDALPLPRHNGTERVTLPSTVGSLFNMTGVGAGAAAVLAGTKPNVQFPLPESNGPPNDEHAVCVMEEPSPHPQTHEILSPVPVFAVRKPSPLFPSSSVVEEHMSSGTSTSNFHTPPDTAQYLEVPAQTDSGASSPKHWTPPVDQPRTPSPPPASPTPPPFGRYGRIVNATPTSSTLLGQNAFRVASGEQEEIAGFRDSAFTTGSDWRSCEIPIKWTGQTPEPKRIPSPSPPLPGAWAPSPVEEKEEGEGALDGNHGGEKTPDKRDADIPIKSPELVTQQVETRKSETGVVGVMAEEKLDVEKEKLDKPNRASEGWVMVNVEVRASPPVSSEGHTSASTGQLHASGSSGLPIVHSTMKERDSAEDGETMNPQNPEAPKATTVPPAKSIVIDTTAAAEVKDKSTTPSSSAADTRPAFKRILSLSKKEKEDKPKEKGSLRQRLKKLGSSAKSDDKKT